MVQDPFLGAAAPGHAHFLQIGAGGTVQQQRPTGEKFGKFGFSQHNITK
jgi:hypothetical protein